MGKGLGLVAAVWCIIIGGMIYFVGGDHWPINTKVLAVVSVVIGLVAIVGTVRAPSANATR